jgi:hypothetical protein
MNQETLPASSYWSRTPEDLFATLQSSPQGCIDAYHKQQQVSIPFFSPQQVFDLGDLFSVADWFYEIHKYLVNTNLVSLNFVH